MKVSKKDNQIKINDLTYESAKNELKNIERKKEEIISLFFGLHSEK